MGKLLIVDGNAILHRAFHAIPPLTTESGQPVNAVHGMVSILLRIVDGLKPTHIAFAFDRSEPTFRKKEFPSYQSQRPETDDLLSSQFEKAREVLKAMKVPFFDKAGFEADDIIGTLAYSATSSSILNSKLQTTNEKKQGKRSTDHGSPVDEVVIVTGDKDQLQLVNEKVKVFMPVSGVTTGKLFGEKEVIEKMGVTPSQIVDYKGLVGDPSDNYPGVFGIGPKTAINLLQSYITLKQIYENLDKIGVNIREKLEKGRKEAEMSYRLATIITDVQFDFNFKDMNNWNLGSEEVVRLFRKFGFRSLTNRIINYDLPAGRAGLGFNNNEGKVNQNFKKNLNRDEIEKTVLIVADRLKGKKYAIRGTAGMVLQGINMGVNDIDVICDKKTALSINKLFKKELFQKVEYSQSDKFKSYFGKAIMDNVLVEFYGEWQIRNTKYDIRDTRGWSKIYRADEDEVIEIEIQGAKIPVTSLETELKTSAEMGRWNEFHKMKKEIEAKNQQKLF